LFDSAPKIIFIFVVLHQIDPLGEVQLSHVRHKLVHSVDEFEE
jgi:hypothetical protein